MEGPAMGKLGIYLVADYPSRGTFLEAVRACQDLGVDFLEIGFPFSDSVADGEVLERASREALRHGAMGDFIEGFREARAIFQGRMYIMTYANIVYSRGVSQFIHRVGPASGLILADLPLREIPLFEKGMRGTSVNIIRFLTPESRFEDIALALRGARDFIYFVSKRGTTGGGFELDEETEEKIGHVRGRGVPVYVGFGIREKRDVDSACKVADGAIIGTKAVSELEHGIGRFRDFLASLRG
jgi:tryptophan synthase alpha chain